MSGRFALTDLGPITKKFAINDREVEVRGITAIEIRELLKRFPMIGKPMIPLPVSAEEFIQTVPEAVPAIIALAFDLGMDFTDEEREQAENAIKRIPIGLQFTILHQIAGATFHPDGFGPFVSRLAAIGIVSGGDGRGQDTRSRRPSPPSQPSMEELSQEEISGE